MEKYFFSGSLTNKMAEYLLRCEEFEPMDVLVSQIDRSAVDTMLGFLKQGVVKTLFIDSGAFSAHTGKSGPIDVDEYIAYVNGLDEYISLMAQVDTLPGTFGKSKSKEDYELSAKKSWENYLYMRDKVKSSEKLISVMHFGESFDALKNMLEWRGPNGEVVEVIGLSPANDTHQSTKDTYLEKCYEIIADSSRPDAKTHLFGMTSLQALSKFPCYSCDSVSHRLRSAYNKVYTVEFGTIPLSDRPRTTKVKSNASFLKTCDRYSYEKVVNLFAHYGFTPEDMVNDNAARVCVDILETQKAIRTKYKYNPANLSKKSNLFNL